MKQLGEDYEQTRRECEQSGYDTAVFDAVLPTTTPIEHTATSQERVQALAESGKIARASGLFRILRSMMYNGDEILEARKMNAESKKKATAAKKKAAEDKEINLFAAASLAYQRFVEEHARDLKKMSASDLTDIVKFLVAVDKQDKECASKYTSNKTRIKRIMEGEVCHGQVGLIQSIEWRGMWSRRQLAQ
eukprot:scaffold38270_cov255-Skeletonema_dohrnii-CCMP3373.AAC.1